MIVKEFKRKYNSHRKLFEIRHLELLSSTDFYTEKWNTTWSYFCENSIIIDRIKRRKSNKVKQRKFIFLQSRSWCSKKLAVVPSVTHQERPRKSIIMLQNNNRIENKIFFSQLHPTSWKLIVFPSFTGLKLSAIFKFMIKKKWDQSRSQKECRLYIKCISGETRISEWLSSL